MNMKDFNLVAKDSKGIEHSISVQTLPDTCPCCHYGIEPSYRFGFVHDNEYPTVRNVYVQAVFQCPRRRCHRIFIADYVKYSELRRDSRDEKFVLEGSSPYWYKKREFSEPIQKLSPSFCDIFNESASAESRKLLNVAGPGYRKALEFLIKDYLISVEPDKADSIKPTALQNLIQNKITDVNLKTSAERATWLGNDETHYLRKWESQDIGDLKLLITLTVNWVENCILTSEFQTKMPKPESK
jgi:hypothetical protein